MSEAPPPYNTQYENEKQQMTAPVEQQQQQQPYPQQPYPQQPYPQQPAQPYPAAGQPPQQPYAQPYGQPQQPYAQPYGQPQGQTVVVTQPGPIMTTTVITPTFGRAPVTMKCPSCEATVTTTVDKKCGMLPWLVCGGICLVGLAVGGITWLGCCLIPFCITDLYDMEHKCPNCNAVVGYKKQV